jgi:hypothetical protein
MAEITMTSQKMTVLTVEFTQNSSENNLLPRWKDTLAARLFCPN